MSKSGSELIAAERAEQIEKHGKTVKRDVEKNRNGELRGLAINVLSLNAHPFAPQHFPPEMQQHIKDKSYKEKMIIAGALIAAEIDRVMAVESES